eukprot:2847045-Rhodomonas_salina.5
MLILLEIPRHRPSVGRCYAMSGTDVAYAATGDFLASCICVYAATTSGLSSAILSCGNKPWSPNFPTPKAQNPNPRSQTLNPGTNARERTVDLKPVPFALLELRP